VQVQVIVFIGSAFCCKLPELRKVLLYCFWTGYFEHLFYSRFCNCSV